MVSTNGSYFIWNHGSYFIEKHHTTSIDSRLILPVPQPILQVLVSLHRRGKDFRSTQKTQTAWRAQNGTCWHNNYTRQVQLVSKMCHAPQKQTICAEISISQKWHLRQTFVISVPLSWTSYKKVRIGF